jgi:hypothetical protein
MDSIAVRADDERMETLGRDREAVGGAENPIAKILDGSPDAPAFEAARALEEAELPQNSLQR